jgi:hypothetical protein
VPPFKTGKGTPLNDTAKVPLDVTGLPDTDKKVGTLIATLVTLPVPAPIVVLVSAALNKVIVLLEFTFINLSDTLFVKVNNDIPLVVPPKLILAFAASVAPVPPFAKGKALPLYVNAKVPLVVTGEPLTVNIDGAVKPTLVTVPLPPPPPLYCGIFNVAPINVAAPLVPVVVSVILSCLVENLDVKFKEVVSEKANLLLNVVQSVDVKYPFLAVVALNNSITGVVVVFVIDKGLPLVPDDVTLVTVPPPMAVRKLAADNAVTELSTLNLGKVMAEGLVKVNIDCPTVVPPKLVLPVAATKPVLPPSHFNLSVYAVFQLLELFVIDVVHVVPVDRAMPASG